MSNLLKDPTALPRRPEALGDASPLLGKVDRVVHPVPLRLHRYWESKRCDERLPSRRDIDPTEIPDLLPYIALVDVLREPLAFRYRLVGTELIYWVGADPTGRTLDELGLPSESRAAVFGAFQHVVAAGEPLFNVGLQVGRHGQPMPVHTVTLPLAADGRTIDMLLVANGLGQP